MLILSQLNVSFRTYDTKFYLLSPLNPQKIHCSYISFCMIIYGSFFNKRDFIARVDIGCNPMNYKELDIQKFNQKQLHDRIYA